MKKILLSAFALLLSATSLFAQNYTFSVSNGTYSNLTGATQLTGTAVWDDTSFVVPVPFNFTFGGNSYNNLEVDSNGLIFLISGMSLKLIIPFDADLLDRGTTTSASPISYAVTGSAGSQILKIEWQNAGFYDGAPQDFINFQLWIYEGSNNIEMHYGSSSISNLADIFGPNTGPDVGLVTDLNIAAQTITGVFLQGPANAPTAVNLNNASNLVYLTGVPPSGTIYRFSTGTSTGISEASELAKAAVFPNPVAGTLYIRGLEEAKEQVLVNIYDLNGRKISSTLLHETAEAKVDVSSLAKGIYMAELISGEARTTTKIVKQ